MGRMLISICLLSASLWASEEMLSNELQQKYFQKETVVTQSGELLEKVTISGPPTPPVGFDRAVLQSNGDIGSVESGTTKTITTPAYDWSFGCTATSAAMLAGYYDRNGYPNVYTGPTAGGVAPMDNSIYGTVTINGKAWSQTPLSATRNGLDGRKTRGHVDDYWVDYGNTDGDPWYGHWIEHTYGSCTGDYMKTNQWYHDQVNSDGATSIYTYTSSGAPLRAADMEDYGIAIYDGAYGMKLFFQSRGYIVDTLYNQRVDTNMAGGFTFAQYKAEIDANRPVVIHVKGHSMLGVGYSTTGSTIYLHDTWDYQTHTMTWGGSYSGMAHYAVSVINISGGSTPTTGITLAPIYYLLGL